MLDALVYPPDSNLLVTRGHDKIQISSADDLAPIRSFGPQLQHFCDCRDRASNGAIAVTKDEETVIASDDSGVIGFDDIQSGRRIRGFPNKVDGAEWLQIVQDTRSFQAGNAQVSANSAQPFKTWRS